MTTICSASVFSLSYENNFISAPHRTTTTRHAVKFATPCAADMKAAVLLAAKGRTAPRPVCSGRWSSPMRAIHPPYDWSKHESKTCSIFTLFSTYDDLDLWPSTLTYDDLDVWPSEVLKLAHQLLQPWGTLMPILVFRRERRTKIFILFIYYTVYTHTNTVIHIVKNRKCGQVTSHCRKARPHRADLSLFLNVPVLTVKSEITVWGRLFQTVGEAWQKAPLEKFRTDALFCIMVEWTLNRQDVHCYLWTEPYKEHHIQSVSVSLTFPLLPSHPT